MGRLSVWNVTVGHHWSKLPKSVKNLYKIIQMHGKPYKCNKEMFKPNKWLKRCLVLQMLYKFLKYFSFRDSSRIFENFWTVFENPLCYRGIFSSKSVCSLWHFEICAKFGWNHFCSLGGYFQTCLRIFENLRVFKF